MGRPSNIDAYSGSFISTLRDYYEVSKPRVVLLMLFTALTGMIMAAGGEIPWAAAAAAIPGIALLAAAAAAINNISDCHIDAVMARTSDRSLPAGRLTKSQVMCFVAATSISGAFTLLVFVNFLTAALTVCSLVGYALIYTRYLKYATPQNIVIGGGAGAAPPVLGWTAVTGHVEAGAVILFLIIFVWTPPHFWALALYKKDEYKKSGLPMLPITHGDNFTRLHILLYSILLVCVSLLPYITDMAGLTYLLGAVLLGAGFLYYAISLKITRSRDKAMGLFQYSIVYLALIFALLLIDTSLLERVEGGTI